MYINYSITKTPARFAVKTGMLWAILALLVPSVIYAQLSKQEAEANNTDISLLKKSVINNPDSLSYHQEYIKAMGVDSPALLVQYDQWITQFPQSATVPFAIGSALYRKEYPNAKPYLLKAVERDPKLAQAWQMLAFDASRWGDETAAREYMGKAAAAAPHDPGYAFYYAMDFEDIDPAKWRSMLYDLARRFPDQERGAQGLYWLATRSTDPEEKIAVYEKLRAAYPPEKFSWSSSGMSGLYDMYLQTDPAKALRLAKDMGSARGWPALDTLAQQTIQVQALMKKKRYKEALKIVNQIKAPRYSDAADMIALLKASVADAAGQTQKAYEDLLLLYTTTPGDSIREALDMYGAKLGKNKEQVNADFWTLKEEKIKPAPAFELGLYTSDKKATLDDYRGKVVLLTFWFPGCGPCRGEFPHFENVLRKFDKKDVAYLAINIVPEQDAYVPSFMKSTQYTFTPLKATGKWAQETYNVRGAPTNFLIDQQGRIVFTNFRAHNPKTERMMELMISAMLQRNATQP